MRMKAVCEATGLTDRAVRYYISEGLIDPDYTENYTGRRTYDFSESDIRQLQDITVLRKFEFTVAEIRSMLRDPAQIEPTVAALRERKRLEIAEEQALLDALERLTDPCANVAELALALCTPAQTALVLWRTARSPLRIFAGITSSPSSGPSWPGVPLPQVPRSMSKSRPDGNTRCPGRSCTRICC